MNNNEVFEKFNKLAQKIFPGILNHPAVMKQFGIQKALTDHDIAEALRSPIENMIKDAFNEFLALVEFKEEINQIYFQIDELVKKIEGHVRALKQSTESSHPSRKYIASMIDNETKMRKLLEEIKKQLENHTRPVAELQFQVICYIHAKTEASIKDYLTTKGGMSILYTVPGFEEKMRDIIKDVPTIEQYKSITRLVDVDPTLVQAKLIQGCDLLTTTHLLNTLMSLYHAGSLNEANFPKFDELSKAINDGKAIKFAAKYSEEISKFTSEGIKARDELGDNVIKSSVKDLINEAKPLLPSNVGSSKEINAVPSTSEPDHPSSKNQP